MVNSANATSRRTHEPDGPPSLSGRWDEMRGRIGEWGEAIGSEWSAVSHALSSPGTVPMRKWLGWALYRVAVRVNPEIREPDA